MACTLIVFNVQIFSQHPGAVSGCVLRCQTEVDPVSWTGSAGGIRRTIVRTG